ncbi:NADPH-dependent F420 reductase [Demequina oxidasica]|uniref:NADPH-dependent F420 reductase n=1 Tax=Demequina oxidasica TaxID=676199 RepID=UPI000A0463F5|nr:NAD(P)-binding domain-containing protein [Demequina oxidasica]
MSTNARPPYSPARLSSSRISPWPLSEDSASSQENEPTVRTVAIFGAGRVGTALARVLVAAQYDVRVVGSGPASAIELIVSVLAPGAVALDAAAAVDGADIVILAVPLHKIDSVEFALLRGKVVVDVMNYWEPIDGSLPDFAGVQATSPVVSEMLAGARVVKAFNHIGYHDIDTDGREVGHPERRALAVAGDNEEAVALVLEMVHRVGFDAVYAGGLAQSGLLEAGGPVFGVRLDRAGLEHHVNQDVPASR